MNEDAYTVTVAKDLEDLIPTFLANRAKELQALRAALAGGDMAQLRHLGHRMKGVGNSYGFARVSEIGRQIEEGATSGDRAALETCIAAYADYLARVRVVYA
ncbi:MAG: Hpt domain-containing protein [Burkholderiales bacterium]|nr:Hpt domain-containing protein [Burkholderiales bacterium]